MPFSKDNQCAVCDVRENPSGTTSVPIGRILEKLDSYLNEKDAAAAERHLKYWLSEADYCGDGRGAFALLNELMGFYRKERRKEDAIEYAELTLDKAEELGIENETGGASGFLNAATVYCAFDEPERALLLYEKAEKIYEKNLEEKDVRLGSLNNNMGTALSGLGRYEEARARFEKAIEIMSSSENGKPDMAQTCLNIADSYEAQLGSEKAEAEISRELSRAQAFLDAPDARRDFYYAWAAEKCVPGFLYYGWFMYAEELSERARSIYERA